RTHLSIGAGALLLLAAGCVSNEPEPPQGANRSPTQQEAKKAPPVVSAELDSTSACTALYSGPSAAAALSEPAVDPGITADGSLQTLILTLNQDDNVA